MMDMEEEMEDMPDEMPDMDEAAEEVSEEPITDEFDMEADAALNTALPMSERRVALKNAIMACMGTDYGKEKKEGGDDMLTSLLGGV